MQNNNWTKPVLKKGSIAELTQLNAATVDDSNGAS
jgi:hypothetical protein